MFRPRNLSYEQIRIEADLFLDEHNPERTTPLAIDEIVEFDLRMEVVPIDGLRPDLRVDAFLSNDLNQVFVDEYVMLHSPARYRFSLAHEVAHYWLHDELYQQSTIRSVNDFLAVQEALGTGDYSLFETQANSFAGLILVPKPPLAKAFRAAAQSLHSAGVKSDLIQHHPTRQFVVKSLSVQFHVSEQTMEIRLERDGFLASASQYPY